MSRITEKIDGLLREHGLLVNGWTPINEPHQTPAATYQGEMLKWQRSAQALTITANECLKIDERHGLLDEQKFWRDILDTLNNN